nr:hypothetical protein [Verrucomicrobiales bacterium]
LYASLVPSALPQEAQDRLNLLLGKKEAIRNHAAEVISQSLNRPPDPPLPPGVNQRRFIRIVETRPDSDIDGLFDDEEMRDYLTDPLVPDSDDDGYTDLDEINSGTDPADAESMPGSPSDPNAPPEIFVESRFRQLAGSVNRSGTAEEFHYEGRYVRRPANSGPWDAERQLSKLLATDGVDSFLTNYPYQSFQRDAQTLQIANWYWLAETDSTPPSGGEQSGGEAHEKAHQEMLEFRLRLTKPVASTISRTFLKILRDAPFTDSEGRAATPEWPLPTTYPPESWPITKVEPITLTISADTSPSANRLVSNAEEINEAVENKMAKLVALVQVEVRQPAINSEGTVGDLETVQEVRFCRWNSPHVLPGGDLVQPQEFPEDDPDRIVIRIPLPHKAGQGVQKIHVSTSGSIGSRNDIGAEVELTELEEDPGMFESLPIALVADEDDDKWAGGRASDGALNDPTFRAWPGGILKIKVPALQDALIDFPIKKFSHHFTCSLVHVGSVDADAASVAATIENLARLPEIYAPLLEKVDFTPVDPEAGVPVISSADLQTIAGADHQLSDTELTDLIVKIDTLNLPADAIKLVFIDKTITDTRFGTNLIYPHRRGDITLYFLSNLVKNNGQDVTKYAYTVAHECGHSLRGAGHSETGGIYDPILGPPAGDPELPWWHLMASGDVSNDLSKDPPRSAKHWYLRDAKIVNEGAGNKFSKKLP